MTPAQLVTDLRERGVSLSLRGDRLSFTSTLPIDRETLAGLKENKPALVAYLSHPLPYQLREEGVLFHAREAKLQPKAEEHAAYAEVLEQETAHYLSWAAKLLDTYPYVMLESPLPWREGYVIASHFKHVGKLAERRIWLDAWAMWGVLTCQNEVLEPPKEGKAEYVQEMEEVHADLERRNRYLMGELERRNAEAVKVRRPWWKWW